MDENWIPAIHDFAIIAEQPIRYRDTDRQGHVNNAVFTTFLEIGRVAFLYDQETPLADEGCSFVIASLHIDYLYEISWPGDVQIGTRITRIGSSSIGMEQGLFQNGRAVARAETTIVQINNQTRRSQILTDASRMHLETLARPSVQED